MVNVGLTVRLSPFPSGLIPHPPLYQYHPAPVPKTPPEETNSEPEPFIIVPGIAEIIPGAMVFVLTVIFTFEHNVVLHIPSALT